MKAPAHVFISYIEADSSVALGIAKELRQLGHDTWTYEEDGLPGHSYLEQVHAAIGWCDAFVLLASTESLKSHQVRREAETAYEQQKFVIPIRLKVTHDQLQASPIFRMVSGTAVSLPTDGTDLPKIAERIAASLRKAGFQRDEESPSLPKVADDAALLGAEVKGRGLFSRAFTEFKNWVARDLGLPEARERARERREFRLEYTRPAKVGIALFSAGLGFVPVAIALDQPLLFLLGAPLLIIGMKIGIPEEMRQRREFRQRRQREK